MGKIHTADPCGYSFLKDKSRMNRSYQTDAEEILWQRIRKCALGVKFRRQHCILDFIVDFICLEKKLIIEVDGEYHNTEQQIRDDQARSDDLYRYGYYVLRFTNDMVINDIDYVLNRIKDILSKL